MHSPENIRIPEILTAVEDGVLTSREVLDTVMATLKTRRAEISSLILQVQDLGYPKFSEFVSFTDFHLLDEQFTHQSVTRAWNSVVANSLRNPEGGLAGVVVNGPGRGLEQRVVDLNVFARCRSNGFSGRYVSNYGLRADSIFRAAVERAGIDSGEAWPKLHNH